MPTDSYGNFGLIEPDMPSAHREAAVTSGDLFVLVPWVIFGVAIAVICYLLFTRRQGPRRMWQALRRRPRQPPPEGQRGEIPQAPPRDQDEGPDDAGPSR